VAALSPPCAITQATVRQHWNYEDSAHHYLQKDFMALHGQI
jgi:hypothetical protein